MSFELYYHHVYERGRASEPMIHGPVLPIRKVLCYLHVIFLSVPIRNNNKKYWLLIPFGFVNLQAVGA
jgi:hypothetical protein